MNDLVTLLSGGGKAIEALGSLAADKLYAAHDGVVTDDAATQAEYLATMLRVAESQRQLLRAAQGWIVMQLVRTGLWQAHPDGYSSLRAFLRCAGGLSESAVSELNTLGEYIVPYCDRHKISLDTALAPHQWGKTREVLSHLRGLIRDEQPAEVVQEVLDVAARASNRDVVRERYRKHYADTIGKGTFIHRDGTTLAVILLNDPDNAKSLLSKLGGSVEWNLIAAQKDTRNPREIEVQVNL